MQDYEIKEKLKKLANAMGIKALEVLSSQLDPDQLLQRASELLGIEVKEAVKEVLEDSDSALVEELVTRTYDGLPEEIILEAITKPLVDLLAEWFREDGLDALVEALTSKIDEDQLMDLIAEKLSGRVRISSE